MAHQVVILQLAVFLPEVEAEDIEPLLLTREVRAGKAVVMVQTALHMVREALAVVELVGAEQREAGPTAGYI